jgi:hypothetical protein
MSSFAVVPERSKPAPLVAGFVCLALALFQTLGGASQASAHALSTLVWCAAIWGVFLFPRELGENAWIATSFAFNPRALLVLLAGALVIVLAVFAVAIPRHPFHLPRFLIPLGVALWPLAALGWSHVLPRAMRVRAAACVAGLAFVAIAPGADTLTLADALGFTSDDPKTRAHQATVFASYRDLGPKRPVQRAGLAREPVSAFLDVVACAVRPEERVALLDVTEQISPAGLHVGLWSRGGSRRACSR